MGICTMGELTESAPATSRAVLAHASDQERRPLWQIAEEVAVAIQFNSKPFAVMMATPADIQDFALGFALAEGLVHSRGAVKGILVMPVENGICADLAIDGDRPVRPRGLEGRSGCGLCGVEDIAAAIRPPANVDARFRPSTEAIARAFAELPLHQPMNALNRSMHAAAFCHSDGGIVLAREDVGRHIALDKLIGALAQQDRDMRDGFVVMTSRCSFELVQKAATAGIPCLATLSAPTTLALDLAAHAGMLLACRAREGVVLFEGVTA